MVHLVREVVDQGMQCTPMLARAIVFEAVRELDRVFEISDYVLAMAATLLFVSNSLA
jgi:hypothetical protein